MTPNQVILYFERRLLPFYFAARALRHIWALMHDRMPLVHQVTGVTHPGVLLALVRLLDVSLFAIQAATVFALWAGQVRDEEFDSPAEVLIPFVSTFLGWIPFLAPIPETWLPSHIATESAVYAGITLGLIGCALSTAGILALGRDFSIFVEARAPVGRGVYRWVRHPIYLGYTISFLGVCIMAPCVWTALYLTVSIALFAARARMEERKLEARFPEYIPSSQALAGPTLRAPQA